MRKKVSSRKKILLLTFSVIFVDTKKRITKINTVTNKKRNKYIYIYIVGIPRGYEYEHNRYLDGYDYNHNDHSNDMDWMIMAFAVTSTIFVLIGLCCLCFAVSFLLGYSFRDVKKKHVKLSKKYRKQYEHVQDDDDDINHV